MRSGVGFSYATYWRILSQLVCRTGFLLQCWKESCFLMLLAVIQTYTVTHFGTIYGSFSEAIISLDESMFKASLLRALGLCIAFGGIRAGLVYLKEKLSAKVRFVLSSYSIDVAGIVSTNLRSLVEEERMDVDQRLCSDLPHFCASFSDLVSGILSAPMNVGLYTLAIWSRFGIFPVAVIFFYFCVSLAVERSLLSRVSSGTSQLEVREGVYRNKIQRLQAHAESVFAGHVSDSREFPSAIERLVKHEVVVLISCLLDLAKSRCFLNIVTSLAQYVGGVVNYLILGLCFFYSFGGPFGQSADFQSQPVSQRGRTISESHFELAMLMHSLTGVLDLSTRLAENAASLFRVQELLACAVQPAGACSEGIYRDVRNLVVPGQWVLLAAASGTGKSTYLRHLATSLASSCQLPSEVVFLPQEALIFNELSLLENVLFPVSVSDASPHVRAFAEGAIRSLSLEGMESGGEAQRVVLARTLSSIYRNQLQGISVKWLLLDECINAVDEDGERAFFDLLRSTLRNKDCVVISVSHRQSTRRFHDRVIPLQEVLSSVVK